MTPSSRTPEPHCWSQECPAWSLDRRGGLGSAPGAGQACLTLTSCLVPNSLSNSQLGEMGSLALKGALEDKQELKRLE